MATVYFPDLDFPEASHKPSASKWIRNASEVTDYLRQQGIWSDCWAPESPVREDASEAEILDAFQPNIQQLMATRGYQTADVISVSPNTPNLDALRQKFISEHTHTEDEVRFFIAGDGFFWFHRPEDPRPEARVFCVHCQAGDLISVPAGALHWFEMGDPPNVKVIRLFTDPSGWTPNYTESGINTAYDFPSQYCVSSSTGS